jgi:putative ABC transport system permease protein
MLAISIGLILAMLVARSSVNAKIEEIKASVATQVTISPAGIQGGMGGGSPLTAEQVEKIKNTDHVNSVASTLTAQLTGENVSLKPSLEPPRIRIMGPTGESSPQTAQEAPVIATGTTTPSSAVAENTLMSGEMIDGTSTDRIALVGKELAEKNNLSVGSTFTMYGETFTVKGIYSTDNRFQDGSVVVPLAALQDVGNQTSEVSSIVATIDSSDNVTSTVAALKAALGDDADITSQEEQAKSSLAPLESIAGLALGGVIAATIAGATIVLLAMIMIVRERRREIGVIKAIGGTNRSVIIQFVTEALTLTIVGGIIGLTLGIAASGPMTQSLVNDQSSSDTTEGPTRVTGNGQRPSGGMRLEGPGAIGSQLQINLDSITGTVTPQTFAASVGMVLLIAIIGSAIPAWAIARVRPAEVLRTE